MRKISTLTHISAFFAEQEEVEEMGRRGCVCVCGCGDGGGFSVKQTERVKWSMLPTEKLALSVA